VSRPARTLAGPGPLASKLHRTVILSLDADFDILSPHNHLIMAAQRVMAAPVDLDSTFRPGMLKGKVLFCTGGGSGICKGMTEAIVRYALSRIALCALTET
jgi:2-hydroxychromene-2-carboxylate isomerase